MESGRAVGVASRVTEADLRDEQHDDNQTDDAHGSAVEFEGGHRARQYSDREDGIAERGVNSDTPVTEDALDVGLGK